MAKSNIQGEYQNHCKVLLLKNLKKPIKRLPVLPLKILNLDFEDSILRYSIKN